MGSRCVEFLRKFIVEVRSRQDSVLACVILAGTSDVLAGLRVLKGAHYRCCGTE